MRHPIFALAALALALPAAAQAQKEPGKRAEETIYSVPAADTTMNAAIAEGKRTLPDFFAHLAKPGPDEAGFMIKYDLLPEPDKAEYIWAEVISHSAGSTVARLINEPFDPRFSYGEKVTVTDGEIVDWGYYRGTVMQGHFTTRVLLAMMTPEAAKQARETLGW